MTLTVRSVLRLFVWIGAVLMLLSASVGVGAPLVTTCTSEVVSSGMWNSAATWDCGHVPVADDIVTIAVDDTITVDVDTAALGSLTVDGFLIIGNDATVRTVTVNGALNIGSGGAVGPGSTAATHLLFLGGNLTNAGSFTGTSAGVAIDVTFDKAGNQTVSGTGTTVFNQITVDMGDTYDNLLDIQSVISMASGRLTLNNGTFKLSSNSTITPFNSSTTIPSTAGLWIANGTVNPDNSTLTLQGSLHISGGVMNIGTSSGNSLDYDEGAKITIDGGELTIAGRLTYQSSADTLTYLQSGGLVRVVMAGSTSGSEAGFNIPNTGSSFTFSAGTIVLVRGTSNVTGDFILAAGTHNVTGGIVQLGDANSPSSSLIRVSSLVPLWDIYVDSSNITARLQDSLDVTNDVLINQGTLDLNGKILTVADTVTNNGALQQTQPLNSGNFHFANLSTDKYKGVEISTETNLGSTTVKVYGNQTTSDSTGTPVNRWYQIHPTNEGTANLTFYFLCAELQGSQKPDNVKVWRYDGSSWAELGNNANSGGTCPSSEMGFVTVNGVDLNAAEDTFVLKIFNPLAVNLETFSATPDLDAGQVTVAWETVNEVDNLGFHLYRSSDSSEAWAQINTALIPSQSPGSPWGYVYEWTDQDVVFGERYVYRLASMDMAGLAEVVDTTEAQFGVWQQVWLPLVGR